MEEFKTELPHLTNISDFAERVNVQRPTIYRAIEEGRIIPVYVGMDKNIFIDYEKYKDKHFLIRQSTKKS